MVLLCKPVRANDRFFRNACSLAAFAHSHGHCRVPESSEWVTLRRFVDRSRALFAEGRLEQEKVDVLANFQFDFGVEVRLTSLIDPPCSVCNVYLHGEIPATLHAYAVWFN